MVFCQTVGGLLSQFRFYPPTPFKATIFEGGLGETITSKPSFAVLPKYPAIDSPKYVFLPIEPGKSIHCLVRINPHFIKYIACKSATGGGIGLTLIVTLTLAALLGYTIFAMIAIARARPPEW